MLHIACSTMHQPQPVHYNVIMHCGQCNILCSFAEVPVVNGYFDTSPNRWQEVKLPTRIFIWSDMRGLIVGTIIISTIGDVKAANGDHHGKQDR